MTIIIKKKSCSDKLFTKNFFILKKGCNISQQRQVRIHNVEYSFGTSAEIYSCTKVNIQTENVLINY